VGRLEFDLQKLFEELQGCDGAFRVPVPVATNVNFEDIPRTSNRNLD
jgi:hypothetical protein